MEKISSASVQDGVAPPSSPPASAQPRAQTPVFFWIVLAALLLAFGWPLFELMRFAMGKGSQLYSHIVLIPVVSLYFVWLGRKHLPPRTAPDRPVAAFFALGGFALIAWHLALRASGDTLARVDVHALNAGAFISLLTALCAWSFGRPRLRALVFPLGFLVFMAPIPSRALAVIETMLQHGSATVAYWLLELSGTPVYRDGLRFVLPGFSMQVARECSGIHSTLALFITSIAGGYLFLRSPSKRFILALAVIPLALLRNGFRVFVIGELCVRIGPEMIHSWVHKQGGPFFFALSLIPFSILLLILYRSDRSRTEKNVSVN